MNLSDLAPTPVAAGIDPQLFADKVTAAAQSSFSLGMKLMGRERRQAMRAVYAFCRIVDDIADGDPPADGLTQDEKLTMLSDWRLEIDRLYRGEPVSAIGRSLLLPVSRYDLPKAEFISMIEGMETDATGPVVAPSLAELRAYTRRVAGSVGMMSLRIFGAWRDAESDRLAVVLADAIQFTNILRDIEEDSCLGRLYLPSEYLDTANATYDPAKISHDPGLSAVSALLGQNARDGFDEASGLIARHSRIPAAPALAMMGVYRRYLDMLAEQGWARHPVATMSRWQKAQHGLTAVFRGC